MPEALQQIPLFEDVDFLSKKRMSLHKVAHHDTETGQVKHYTYHMVIVDPCMTLNLELAENTIINLVNAMKQ